MPHTTAPVLPPHSSSASPSTSSAHRTRRVAAWLAGALLVAGAAVAALSVDGPKTSSSPGESAEVAVALAGTADAASDARQARLAAMRARVDALQARVDALPAKPAHVTPATVKPGPRPVKPARPPVVSDDDGGRGPIAIDPACLANPLCLQR